MGKVNSKQINKHLAVSNKCSSAGVIIPRSSMNDLPCASCPSSNNVALTKLYCSDDAWKYNECDRAQMKHFFLRDMWKGNFSSPVEDTLQCGGARVLDVGCGAGAWTLEMASTYQNSKFHGVDTSPLFPTCIKPGNAEFTVANILKGLPFDDNVFDFVHIRFIGKTISEYRLEDIIEEIIRITKPGGWIEVCKSDTLWQNAGPKAKRLRSRVTKEIFAIYEIRVESGSKIGSLFRNNHFLTNLNHEEKIIPLGSWGGKLGSVHLENVKWGLKNVMKVVNSLGWTDEKYNHHVNSVIREIESKGNVFDVNHRFWARKL